MIALNEKNFDSNINDNAALILFWADWCPLCIILLDVFEELTGEYGEKITIATVNYDENAELAERFEVFGVPTAISLNCGKVTDVRPGFREKGQYEDMINAVSRKLSLGSH